MTAPFNDPAVRATASYLGDGIYAHFDGAMVWLSTERAEGWHVIALEPDVLSALVAYARKTGMAP